MKQCAKCMEWKDESEFHKNKRNKDGLHSYCKKCNSLKAKEFNQTVKGKENLKKAYQKQYESGYFKYGKGAIINMSKSAEKRGIPFELDEQELMRWWTSNPDRCEYCGTTVVEYRKLRDFVKQYDGDDWRILRFKRFFNLENQAKIDEMTIDRVDNKGGYNIKNIKKACWFCNSLKSDFYEEDEIRLIGSYIVNKLKKMMGDNNERD